MVMSFAWLCPSHGYSALLCAILSALNYLFTLLLWPHTLAWLILIIMEAVASHSRQVVSCAAIYVSMFLADVLSEEIEDERQREVHTAESIMRSSSA